MAADPIQIRILHNENPNAMLDGYTEGDPLAEIYSVEKFLPHREYATISLEYIFEQNQWIDENHRPWYSEARSLSKGDVIVLGEKAYAVATIGFDELHVNVEELVR